MDLSLKMYADEVKVWVILTDTSDKKMFVGLLINKGVSF